MRWEAIVLVSFMALNCVLAVASIGKPRKPTLEPGVAAVMIVVAGLQAWLIIRLGTA